MAHAVTNAFRGEKQLEVKWKLGSLGFRVQGLGFRMLLRNLVVIAIIRKLFFSINRESGNVAQVPELQPTSEFLRG